MEQAYRGFALPRSAGAERATVLVVDDSRLQRRILSSYLTRWGYRVIEAASGETALAVCQFERPDLIVSDWMMPGMGGLEFCRAFRQMRSDRYGYFILLTSKSEKGEIAEGLDVGADDFLTKPVNGDELRARIRAGQRVLRMERELQEKNRLVTETLAEMKSLYAALDRDLVEAQRLQHSLVRERTRRFGPADVALLLRPAGHVGGDLVGVFRAGEDQIGLYSIDVSGHGIASALITARLAAYLSGTTPEQNVAITARQGRPAEMREPAEVARYLNRLVLEEMQTEHYFTLLLARVGLADGHVTMVQAGHPHPAVMRVSGGVEFVGRGGLPIGLVDGAEYAQIELSLAPGDRLFVGSDGFTECTDANGAMLDDEGLAQLLRHNAGLRGERFLDALTWDLTGFAGDSDFDDDVSAVLLDYRAGARSS